MLHVCIYHKEVRGSLTGAVFLKSCSEKWKDLSSDEKQQFKDAAEAKQRNRWQCMYRDEVVKRQLDSIMNACDVLTDVGFEVGGLGFDPKSFTSPTVFGSTSRSLNFFAEKREEYEFEMSANQAMDSTLETKIEKIEHEEKNPNQKSARERKQPKSQKRAAYVNI